MIGGFLAGTGWLLCRGALGVMTGMNIGLDTFEALFKPEIFLLWSLGVLYGTLLMVLLRRFSHFLLVPGVILNLAADIEHKLSKDVLTTREAKNWRVFPDLDHGIEWCEGEILSQMASLELTSGLVTLSRSCIALDGLTRMTRKPQPSCTVSWSGWSANACRMPMPPCGHCPNDLSINLTGLRDL